MEEFMKEHIDYMQKTLENYYFLKRESQRLKKEAFVLEERVRGEMEANGISYDKESGTYNNTDTPYINQLIHEQSSADLEAIHYDEMAKALDKHNKITERLKSISSDQQLTIRAICEKQMSLTSYANAEGVSRQAICSRLENALRAMLEVE